MASRGCFETRVGSLAASAAAAAAAAVVVVVVVAAAVVVVVVVAVVVVVGVVVVACPQRLQGAKVRLCAIPLQVYDQRTADR